MTVEDAVEKSKILLGEEENTSGFYSDLEKSLIEIQSHPQEEQLELGIPSEEAFTAEISNISKPSKPPRPQQPPVDHYRVAVWRDSRDDRVNVKVTKA